MEPKSPFDLSQAFKSWRTQLAQTGSLSPDNLEEIENHLRESMDRLKEKGLSDEESWMIAQRRLGSTQALHQEFTKANPERLWNQRALWMATGFIVVSIIQSLSIMFGQLTPVFWPDSSQGGVLGITSISFQLALFGLGLTLIWRSGQSGSGIINRWGQWMIRHPLWAGFTLLLALLMVQAGTASLHIVLSRLVHVSTLGTMAIWQTVSTIMVNILLWPALIVLLLRRQRAQASLS